MANKRLKIGLDVDGVLAAFSPRFVEMANEMFDYRLDADNQTDWDHTCLGLTKQEEDAVWKRINSTPNWWLYELPMLPSTQNLTTAARHHKLYFITNRNQTTVGMPMEEQTAHWLRRHFWIPNPTVIVTKQKGKVVDALELDYFIDDKLENVQDVLANSDAVCYLHEAPYNKHIQLASTHNDLRATSNVNSFLTEIGAFGDRE